MITIAIRVLLLLLLISVTICAWTLTLTDPNPNSNNNRNLFSTTAVSEIACITIKYSYDVTHRIPSLACSEPGCAGKHCYS